MDDVVPEGHAEGVARAGERENLHCNVGLMQGLRPCSNALPAAERLPLKYKPQHYTLAYRPSQRWHKINMGAACSKVGLQPVGGCAACSLHQWPSLRQLMLIHVRSHCSICHGAICTALRGTCRTGMILARGILDCTEDKVSPVPALLMVI